MLRIVTLTAVLIALPGCVAVDNDAVTVGPTVTLSTFSDTDGLVPAPPADAPSDLTLGQRNWEPIYFLVEEKNVWHTPTYASPLESHVMSTARSRGEYPSEATCLDEKEHPHGKVVMYATGAPFVAAADAILLIPRMFYKAAPWKLQDSPSRGYQRFARDRETTVRSMLPLAAPAN